MPWQANLGEGGEMCTIQVKKNKIYTLYKLHSTQVY